MSGNKQLTDSTKLPPFEASALRTRLLEFFEMKVQDPSGKMVKVGNYSFGVYAFFDYDGEPIYVGQTNERIRTRIGRHLTNQRTDAVAMSVLDPFEVFDVEVWPVPQFQGRGTKDAEARAHLDALERRITTDAVAGSRFGAILNEKDPPPGVLEVEPPPSHRVRIVSGEVGALRSHPDVRIARRAQVISRLAQVISERKVQPGLRRVLLVQSRRLAWLAQRRFDGLGVASLIETETGEEDEDDGGTKDLEAEASQYWKDMSVRNRIEMVQKAGLSLRYVVDHEPDPALIRPLVSMLQNDDNPDVV